MKIVCFGEMLLRLCPPEYGRFVQAERFEACYGGSEANVAVALANFGADCGYVTNLPAQEIGQAALNALRRYGVDTAFVNRREGRLGLYYLEKGASQRPSKVIYDRRGSAFALAERGDFDWEEILDGADLFHFSGITPALGGNLPDICMDAIQCARRKGVTVCCDVNYRRALWTYAEAAAVLLPMMAYTDILIANEEHADLIFGVHALDAPEEREDLADLREYETTARLLAEKCTLRQAVITLRRTLSASDNVIAAVMYDTAQRKCFFSHAYTIRIVDRVGGGDALDAGLIYALLNGRSGQETVEFAVASSVLKHTISGDANLISAGEADALIQNQGKGRLTR